MIPILAGIAAVGPVANMFTEITRAVSQPNPAEFNQSLENATAVKPEQIQVDSILKGRTPAQLLPTEQQQLANLLVGQTVQMIGTEGQSIQGKVAQSKTDQGNIQLQVQGQAIDLSQITAIQIS